MSTMNWLYEYITNIIHPQPKDEIMNALTKLESRIPEMSIERSWANILLAQAQSDAQSYVDMK